MLVVEGLAIIVVEEKFAGRFIVMPVFERDALVTGCGPLVLGHERDQAAVFHEKRAEGRHLKPQIHTDDNRFVVSKSGLRLANFWRTGWFPKER